MAIYSGFSHWKWWFSIVMLNYQRVATTCGATSRPQSDPFQQLGRAGTCPSRRADPGDDVARIPSATVKGQSSGWRMEENGVCMYIYIIYYIYIILYILYYIYIIYYIYIYILSKDICQWRFLMIKGDHRPQFPNWSNFRDHLWKCVCIDIKRKQKAPDAATIWFRCAQYGFKALVESGWSSLQS